MSSRWIAQYWMSLPVGGRRLVAHAVRFLCILLVSFDTRSLALTGYAHFGVGLLIYPLVVRRITGVRLSAATHIWISVAAVFHPIGLTYTAYRQYWFYDKISHIVGATVVGSTVAVTYVAWRTSGAASIPESKSSTLTDSDPGEKTVSVSLPRLLVATAFGVLILGCVWEVYELAVGYLTIYGTWDTIGDTIANQIGGLGAVILLRHSLTNIGMQIGEEWDRSL